MNSDLKTLLIATLIVVAIGASVHHIGLNPLAFPSENPGVSESTIPHKNPRKAELLNYMSQFAGASRHINHTGDSLVLAKELQDESLTPEEALIVADLLIRIRSRVEERMVDSEQLKTNRLATAQVLEQLVTSAKDHVLKNQNADIYDCRMYLAKLFEEEAKMPGADHVELRRKAKEWEMVARGDPRQLIKKIEKEISNEFP